jgi:hypothetical protein
MDANLNFSFKILINFLCIIYFKILVFPKLFLTIKRYFMKPSNFTNLSGGINNLIGLIPNGLNSQSSSLLDQSATPVTPTTNVDNSFPITQFVFLTATAIGTLSIVVCGARFLYNRMNSRRANGDNIQVAEVRQGGRGIEMSIQPRTNIPDPNALSSVVSVSAVIRPPIVNNQMPLPQSPASLETNDQGGRAPSPSPLPQSPSPLSPSPLPPQSSSRGV